MKPFHLATLALVTVTGFALAADALTLPVALEQAFRQGPDLKSSAATLQNARADLSAKETDPSTLILPLTQARQMVALNAAQFEGKKLEVVGNVVTAYLNLFEAQENIGVLGAQVALDAKNLEIAKIKLDARNGTALDVAKAQNTLGSSQQSLVDAKASLAILSNRLEPLLGLKLSGNLTVTDPPAFKEVKLNQDALEQNLEARLPLVLQAAQLVELNELNVRLSDNDYTPPTALRDSKVTLENARRNLDSATKSALTGLRDASRGVQNALEQVKLRAKDLQNARDALALDQTKAKSGTISKLQLQTSEVTARRSEFSYAQAVDAYWRALTQLSNASGSDVIGWLPKAAQ